jgi:hypothetical protein
MARIREADRVHKSTSALALDMVRHQRALGIRFGWVGADESYGKEATLLRGLEAMGEAGDTRGLPCERTPAEAPASSELLMLEEPILQEDKLPLLSCSDIESLLRSFLPHRDVDHDEVLRQMQIRGRKLQAALDSQYRKQARQQLFSG